MYNLLVSANENEWEGQNFNLEISRCINEKEYTDSDFAKKYGGLNISDIKILNKLPCVFAYEDGCNKNPKFGFINQVVKGNGSLEISYKITKPDLFLTNEDISKMKFELGISSFEMKRTHWALKNVDLKKVLLKRNIKISKKMATHTTKTAKEKQGSTESIVIQNVKNTKINIGEKVRNVNKNTKENNKNHPWNNPWLVTIIGGIIVGIIVGLVLYFLTNTFFNSGKANSKVEYNQQTTSTITITPNPTLHINSVSPKEISDEIKKLPPLQQREAGRNYQGINISWSLFFLDIFPSYNKKGVYTIHLQDQSGISIVCDINIDDYPVLKITKKSQKIDAEGTILNVEDNIIFLDKCKLLISKRN